MSETQGEYELTKTQTGDQNSKTMSDVRKLLEADRTAKIFSLADLQAIVRKLHFANKEDAETFMRYWDQLAEHMLIAAERHRVTHEPQERDPIRLALQLVEANGHALHKEWTQPSVAGTGWSSMNQCVNCGAFVTVYADGSVKGKPVVERCNQRTTRNPSGINRPAENEQGE